MEKESLTGSLQIWKGKKMVSGNVHAVIDMDMEINEGEFIVLSVPPDAENNAATHDSRT